MLQRQIDSMLYERTALSRKPEKLAQQELKELRDSDCMTPDLVFKDPYFLDFLGLKDRYLERDLEDAILREMEAFLLELGSSFAFLARQKRIQIDSDDFYIDLLFFNRQLKRLKKDGKFFVEAAGRAKADKFARAWIEAGRGKAPKKWIKVSEDISAPVNNGQLALISQKHFKDAKV